MENQLWYTIGFFGDRVAYAEHDFTSRSDAEIQARKIFDDGMVMDGELVKFDRVVAVSESHETALDISRGTDN